MPEEFDLEKFNAEFEASQQQEEVIDEEVLEDEVVADEILDEEEPSPEGDGDPSLKDPNEDLGTQSEEETKRNAAFAQLRRERDEAKRVADWLKSVADQNGTTPEEMMENYQKALLEKQAQEQNVPVEVLQRLKAQEDELNHIKNSSFAERFESQVLATKETYNASEDDLDTAFKYAADNGLVEIVQSGRMTFDALYKMAHLDTLTERKVQEALQNDLTKKKKRQQEAPLPNGSSAAPTDDSLEDRAKKDAARFIAEGY